MAMNRSGHIVSNEPRRGRLLVVALATAIGSPGLAAGGTAGALLGVALTGTETAVGLPLGLLVVGQAVSALFVSSMTGRVGRGLGLALGYALGTIGAVVVILAAVAGSFAALLVGSTVLGAGNTAVFLARYAAAEVEDAAARGRALVTVHGSPWSHRSSFRDAAPSAIGLCR